MVGDMLERQLSMLLPHGGLVVVEYEAYFDESGCDDYSRVLVVGGYLFEKSEALRIETEWKKILKKYDLPFFHMVDCAHGNEHFARFKDNECVEIQKEFISLLVGSDCRGVACLIPTSRHEVGDKVPDAYPFAVQGAALDAVVYASIDADNQAKVSFYFEKGHVSQSRADAVMSELSEKHKAIASYVFAGKEDVCLLQAADLLSWQCAKNLKDKVFGNRKMRKDFEILAQNNLTTRYFLHKDKRIYMQVVMYPYLEHPETNERLRQLFNPGEFTDYDLVSWFSKDVKDLPQSRMIWQE